MAGKQLHFDNIILVVSFSGLLLFRRLGVGYIIHNPAERRDETCDIPLPSAAGISNDRSRSLTRAGSI